MYGKVTSQVTKDKLSLAKSGKNHWSYDKTVPDVIREKIRNKIKGQIITDITRDKLSDSTLSCLSRPLKAKCTTGLNPNVISFFLVCSFQDVDIILFSIIN